MFVSILGYLPVPSGLTEGKIVLAEWCLLFFIAWFFVKNKWLKAWIAWVVVCLVIRYNKISYMQANTIFCYIIFYQLLEDKFTDKAIHWTYNLIAVIILIHVSWIWMQFFDIWKVYMLKPGFMGHFPGVMGENNSAGALIALGIPVFLRKKWCWFLLLLLGTFLLPKPLTAIASTFVGLAVFSLIKLPKWRFWIIGSMIGAFALYCLKCESFNILRAANGRFKTWKLVWGIIRVNPPKHLIGFGVGHYRVIFPLIDAKVLRAGTKIVWFRAHNEYLELIFNQGLIGLWLILEFIGSSIERFLKKQTELGFIAFIGIVISLVSCLGHFLAHTTVFIISVLYMSILSNQCNQCNQNQGREE